MYTYNYKEGTPFAETDEGRVDFHAGREDLVSFEEVRRQREQDARDTVNRAVEAVDTVTDVDTVIIVSSQIKANRGWEVAQVEAMQPAANQLPVNITEFKPRISGRSDSEMKRAA